MLSALGLTENIKGETRFRAWMVYTLNKVVRIFKDTVCYMISCKNGMSKVNNEWIMKVKILKIKKNYFWIQC